jgi:general stress protein 26
VQIPVELKEFLESEVVCSLAVIMPHGEVHVAALLFWCDTDTLTVYVSTSKHTEKMWWHPEHKQVSAAVAIGLQKSLPYSVQMRGKLEIFDPTSNTYIAENYKEIASELDDITKSDIVMLKFTPLWARYTDRAGGYITHQISLDR